jgi:hypothetical protein
MEWIMIAILSFVAVLVVYRVLNGTVNFLAKLALVIVSILELRLKPQYPIPF